jgi:hypothetical protein
LLIKRIKCAHGKKKKRKEKKKNLAFLGSVMSKIPALTKSEKVSANVNGLFALKGLVTVGIG